MAELTIGIVAGEKSGDYLGAQLIKAIRVQHPEARFIGLCGPQMQAQGAVTLAEMDKISIMGLEGLFGSLREILAIRKSLFQHFRDNPPDVFIGVDVPDFNLTLEKKLRALGIPAVHCVSPTVWAWRSGRVKKIRKAVDLMLTLFPFETDFYNKHSVPVSYIGHPLAKEIQDWPDCSELRSSLLADGQTLIALMPGSRMSEVSRLAEPMIEAANLLAAKRQDVRFVIPAASDKIKQWLDQKITADMPITLLDGQSRDVLAACDLVALASGTAALEAALFAKPMVVMYKVAWLSAAVFGHTIQVEHFSMPNHLTDKPMVPELIQKEASSANLLIELERLLGDQQYREQMRAALAQIAPRLAEDSASLAADSVLELIGKQV